MAHAIKASRTIPRNDVENPPYVNPPVHEVVLDVQFHRSLDEKRLRELRSRLAESFPQAEQMNLMQMEMTLGPSGQGYQNTVRQFGGWQLKRDGGWVLQTGPMALTLHLIREGQQWPVGPYVGWKSIHEQYLRIHAALLDVYGGLEPKRAGLRYLNRIAIPLGENVSDWLAFKLQAPKLLHDLYAFHLRQTWARAGEHEDISATIGLAKIDVGDPAVAAENYGVLLDIDIFNLWIEKAPSYQNLPDWFKRAHEVENGIFEGCLTNALRERFNKP